MKKVSKIFLGIFLVLSVNNCFAQSPSIEESNKGQNIQIFSLDNSNGKINAKSIEKAFNESGVTVDVNNDMNSIFSKRYGNIHHKNYNLAIFHDEKSILNLMKKYPSIGLITPLSMSIYSDDTKNTINISTSSLNGMSRITKIPVTNTDLIAYAKSVDTALHKALPNGAYIAVNHDIKPKDKSLTTDFSFELELEDGTTYSELKEDFKAEFEGELGPVGYLVPKSYKFQHDDYDFFDTYSIIRFNAIYPVSKKHPDAGAYAPFSLVMYKKKDNDTVHIQFPSINNWINDLGIKEEETIKAVNKTHNMIKDILLELTE